MEKTIEEIKKMWSPVIDSLAYNKDKDFSEDFKTFLAIYADHHGKIDNDFMLNNDYISTLPISLKILSKLNLDGIKLNIIDYEKK